jgi:hypothetical protein
MYKVLLLAGVLALGGCGTTGNGPVSLTSIVQQVQQAAVATCSFLPTVATVSNIIAPLVPGAVGPEQLAVSVASQICAAVTGAKASGALKSNPPTVRGVVIHGRFVSR